MDIDFMEELTQIGKGAAFFVELLILLVIGKLAKDKLAGYALDDELTKEDNPAVATSFAGYIFGMLIALSGVFASENETYTGFGQDFLYDLGNVALWGLFAISALNASRILTDRVLLKGFGNLEELVRDKNIGVGICEAGGYIASGLIIRASIAGEGVWWLAPVLLVVGLALLMVSTLILRRIVFKRFNLLEEIEKDNFAAGALLGFHVLALGYLIHRMIASTTFEALFEAAREGRLDQSGLITNLGIEAALSAIYLVVGLGALIVLTAVTDRLMLPKDKLQDEIIEDRNMGAALISGAVAVGGAILVMTVF